MIIKLLLVLAVLNFKCSIQWSSEKIKTYYKVDRNIKQVLQEHLEAIRLHRFYVTNYILENQYMKSANLGANVLLIFKLFNRLSFFKNHVVNKLLHIVTELMENIYEAMIKVKVSYNQTLIDAANITMKLQDFYLLNPHELADGYIMHLSSPGRLTVNDRLFFADVAKRSNRLDHYVFWTEQAFLLVKTTSKNITHIRETAKLYKKAQRYHDKVLRKKIISKNTGSIANIAILPFATSEIAPSYQKILMNKHKAFYLDNYFEPEICHLGSQTDIKVTSKLTCHFLSRPYPFITIFRFKVEIQAISPYIITIYDVISDAEAESLIELAIPKLQPAHVHREDNSVGESKVRISESCWLFNSEHPAIKNVLNRVHLITGYKTIYSQGSVIQIANYGPGGMYWTHTDFQAPVATPKIKIKLEDSLATFLIYLNDVKMGGGTAFVKPQILLPAKKRAATFWYNFDELGMSNVETAHCGCPVLYGNKWIATNWILVNEQPPKKCFP